MLRVNILPNVRIASGKIFKQCTAWKSTIVEAECPVTGAKSQSSRNKSSADGRPQFHKVPAYPVVGSMIPQLSGIPMEMKGGNVYTFWPAMKEKFGEFYTMGLPVVGKGLTGELLVIQDPQAMMDLIRREGIYPSGSAQNSWAFREILNGIGTCKDQVDIQAEIAHCLQKPLLTLPFQTRFGSIVWPFFSRTGVEACPELPSDRFVFSEKCKTLCA